MKKYFYTNKKTKQIAMMSDGKIKVDKNIFDEKEMTLTDKEFKDINWSKKVSIKKNKIVVDKNIFNEIQLDVNKEKLEEIDNAKKVFIKNGIIKIIK